MLEWGTCPREAGPPGPRLSSPRERERNAVMAIRMGVNMLQFCSVSNSLSHSKTFSNPFEPFQIKWEVYFSKELCRSSLLCRRYDSACICVCIVGHGYTTSGTSFNYCPVGWSCRIHRLHLCKGVRHPPYEYHDMTLNHLMARLQ